ncbi:MAG: dihydropteroate synthase [Rhodospirillaceae bacterium]|jgi:dihydropteroate synthase|nr:dihydropteroate synthase [Rhodospirillaceae bacterium]
MKTELILSEDNFFLIRLNYQFYARPSGIVSGKIASDMIESCKALRLAGSNLAFSSCLVLLRENNKLFEVTWSFDDILKSFEDKNEHNELENDVYSYQWKSMLTNINKSHTFAGLKLDRPVIMGIVNVTPDSFSDGGLFFDHDMAIKHGLQLLDAGADIIDVGGESTRPESKMIDSTEEIRRVLPVIRAFVNHGAIVSIDTRNSKVMKIAIDNGVTIINDISALEGDPKSLEIVAESDVSVILMHMLGKEPQNMQNNPHYTFAPTDVFDYLEERLVVCFDYGITPDRLCVDPGIGFGKSVDHNLQILTRIGLYHALGVPILLGVSRKSFIGKLSCNEKARERLPGSLTAALLGLEQGVQILRVHDVAETIQAISVWQSIKDSDGAYEYEYVN